MSDQSGNELSAAVGKTTGEEAEAHARATSIHVDTWTRAFMVAVVSGLFLYLNIRVMSFTELIFQSDLALIKMAPNTTRIVTAQVLLALIGATVVQAGVVIVAVTAYLFPKSRTDKGS